MKEEELFFSKGKTRKQLKAQKLRHEAAVAAEIRGKVALRDGDCRLLGVRPFTCCGVPEWAHLGDKRRFKTRGMDPEERHTTRDSVIFCTAHHRAYDAHRFDIEYMTPDGADNQLKYIFPGFGEYIEPAGPRGQSNP